MTRRIHSILFHTILLSVYAVFFSVQFFYNFDGQSEGHSKNGISISKNTPSHSSSSPRTIRLNKRFHQENISPCAVLCVEAPARYALHVTLGHYKDVFLPAVIPAHYPLRGPPVVA